MKSLFDTLFEQGTFSTMPRRQLYELHKRGVCRTDCGFCRDERDEVIRHAHSKCEAESRVNK